MELPHNRRQLWLYIAKRLLPAACVIGAAAGVLTYFWGIQQAENTALVWAARGVRHLELPGMSNPAQWNQQQASHGALKQLLDRNRLIGIRVYDKQRALIYESWSDIPESLVRAAQAPKKWPGPGQQQEAWVTAGAERLVQVVLPASDRAGTINGYLEGIGRASELARLSPEEQIQNGILTVLASVIITTLLLYPLMYSMLRKTVSQANKLLSAHISLLHALGNAAAKRDSDTDAHNYRVTLYAVALAEKLDLKARDVASLVVGAFLHDVGKIGISDTILLKPGKLDPDEFEIMKTHPLLGLEIVGRDPWLSGGASVIRAHHERFDGTGYPDALSGHDIPYLARIFAVVDVFDALTSARPYKHPIALEESLQMMAAESGKHFDPEIFEAFRAIARLRYQAMKAASSSDLQHHLHQILGRYFKA